MNTLKAGAAIDIVAPSSPPSNQKWRQGLKLLKSWGLKPLWDQNSLQPWLFHAHNNRQRLALLKQALLNKNSSAIWMLRGGSGLQKLMPGLASSYPLWGKTSKNKLFIGYSDATALHLYLSEKNQASLHAPNIEELADLPPVRQKELKNILFGAQKEVVFNHLKVFLAPAQKPAGPNQIKKTAYGNKQNPADRSPAIERAPFQPSLVKTFNNKQKGGLMFKKGLNNKPKDSPFLSGGYRAFQQINLQGRIAGGNLSLLSSHIGAPYMPTSFASRFLFIEDVNEEAYKIDRLLHHALYSGVLKGVKALLFGSFEPLGKKAIQKILNSFSAVFSGPLIFGLPCGHGAINRPLPLNCPARLSIQGEKASLSICAKQQ